MAMKYHDFAVIIPVYNEAGVIREVLNKVLRYTPYVMCVNDGSRDASSDEILKTSAYLVEHPINMGQGAALQTGIEFARQFKNIQYFVTFDADGQHRIEDAETMLNVIREQGCDIVMGSRFMGKTTGIGKIKYLTLKLAIQFSNLTSGLKLTDTHNGLRVMNRKVVEQLQITMPDMSHASEILEYVAEKKFTYKEVPVTIEYTEYSRAKGQSVLNAVNIAFDMLLRKVAK